MTRLTVYDDNAPACRFSSPDAAAKSCRACAKSMSVSSAGNAPVHLAPDASSDDHSGCLPAISRRADGRHGRRLGRCGEAHAGAPASRRACAKNFSPSIRIREPEIRFFVAGSGHFVLHENGKVYDILCEKDDLIQVPAGIKHWFDAGSKPSFTALARVYRHVRLGRALYGRHYFDPLSRHVKPAAIITDIEGTTTPIAFVHRVLFPLCARTHGGLRGIAAIRCWRMFRSRSWKPCLAGWTATRKSPR